MTQGTQLFRITIQQTTHLVALVIAIIIISKGF